MPIIFHRHFSLGTILYIVFVIAVVGTVGVYALFQARHVIEGPLVTLRDEPAQLQSFPTITIAGDTENITSLTLNGRAIYTDEQGHFEETLILPKGYTILTLTALDRYGRVHSVERTYIRT